MTYTRNAVYDSVVKAITAEFPNCYCTSRNVGKPTSFPACYIREMDRSRPLRYTQLDFEDVQWESTFEIQIASDKHGTAASEAYKIMDVARSAFSSLYYREFTETSMDNGTMFILIGRFRRVIGGGDIMPTTGE